MNNEMYIPAQWLLQFLIEVRISFAQVSANSSMSFPLLSDSASNGTMLCWWIGALLAATGWAGESITLKAGRVRDESPDSLSCNRVSNSSYVNKSGSVLEV
jgi:hypothetical protein